MHRLQLRLKGYLMDASVQGCKCLIAIERAKLLLGKPDPDSAYWN